MEIKKNQNDPTQKIQNPPMPHITSLAPLSQDQKKTSSVGLGALGNLTASKTSAPELRINIDLLAFELQEIELMLLFVLDPLAGLILTEDPSLSSMIKVGNQYFIKEGQLDAIMSHLDKNDYQVGPVDFRNLEKTVIPEELWGELHIQIGNLKPLLLAVVPQTLEAKASENGITQRKPSAVKQQAPPPPTAAKASSKSSSQSTKWQQAMSLFLDETNKILKGTKERHEKEKIDEQIAHKEEIIKKEIENYEEKLSRIKKSTTQEEMFTHLKEWSESIPPCPIRLLNAMTMWRELVNKCLVKNALG